MDNLKVCSSEAQALLRETFTTPFLFFVIQASFNDRNGQIEFPYFCVYVLCGTDTMILQALEIKIWLSPQGDHNLLREAHLQVSN